LINKIIHQIIYVVSSQIVDQHQFQLAISILYNHFYGYTWFAQEFMKLIYSKNGLA